MKLLAEKNKKGYCPLCGNKLGESISAEYDDDYLYLYYDCGKCEATQVEEVYTLNEEYSHSNAWKPIE